MGISCLLSRFPERQGGKKPGTRQRRDWEADKRKERMSLKRKFLATAGALALAGGLNLAVGMAPAFAAPPPLPAYPGTTTLSLSSPNCVTHSVIMNDPPNAIGESPGTITYGSDGNPVVNSIPTPPVYYSLWWLDGTTWDPGPPLGVQINKVTGEIASYNGGPGLGVDWSHSGVPALHSTTTFTVRDHGEDAVGAKGTEQFQIRVVNDGVSTTVQYEGNDSDNADGRMTIGLNAGSTTSTALTLAPDASSLGIPGPVVFELLGPTDWSLVNNVLTNPSGHDVSDPQFKVTTANFDVAFFTLTGISATSSGVFYMNNDANPCVTGVPDTVSVADPGTQSTTVNTSTSLALSASASNSDSITSYSASGLPAGLSLNTSTGVISGIPTSVGSSTVTVTASDSDETSSSVSFIWNIIATTPPPPPPPSGIIGPGYVTSFTNHSGSCLTNGTSSWAPYAPIQEYYCGFSAADQSLELVPVSGQPAGTYELAFSNGGGVWCVTESSATGSGRLVVGQCNTGNPGYNRQFLTTIGGAGNCHCGVFYRFVHTGFVIDDYGWNTANGATIGTWIFNGGRNQGWSTP
jgi:putative Ig domain-containing protein